MRHQLFYFLLGLLCLTISIYVLRIKDPFISFGSLSGKTTASIVDEYTKILGKKKTKQLKKDLKVCNKEKDKTITEDELKDIIDKYPEIKGKKEKQILEDLGELCYEDEDEEEDDEEDEDDE
jgi:hypothetical protein